MPDVPACFPTSQELHKKEENFYSYTTFAKHVENLNIIPTTSADGQTPSKIYVEQLVFKGQDQLKELIENLTRDVIANIQHNGTFITQDCAARGGETGPIELDPSSSRSNGSNRPEVIEKAILVNEIKESTGKKYHAIKN